MINLDRSYSPRWYYYIILIQFHFCSTIWVQVFMLYKLWYCIIFKNVKSKKIIFQLWFFWSRNKKILRSSLPELRRVQNVCTPDSKAQRFEINPSAKPKRDLQWLWFCCRRSFKDSWRLVLPTFTVVWLLISIFIYLLFIFCPADMLLEIENR